MIKMIINNNDNKNNRNENNNIENRKRNQILNKLEPLLS